MVINVISKKLEATLIEITEFNLDLEPVSTPIIPPVRLNVYESGNRFVFSLTVFLIM